MSKQPTSKATSSVTSSLESEDGRLRFGWRDGRKIGQSGQDHVPVSRFRARGSEKAMPINDTCGPLFNASSPSAGLQQSLGSRLRARMDVNGSPLYALTWSEWDMPAGVRISRLRASARRTSGNGFGGWQTPTTRDGKGQSGKGNRTRRGRNGHLHVANLCDQIVDCGRPDLVRCPEFRRLLMGYPKLWESVAPMALRLSRK